jgi:hypothetical protein
MLVRLLKHLVYTAVGLYRAGSSHVDTPSQLQDCHPHPREPSVVLYLETSLFDFFLHSTCLLYFSLFTPHHSAFFLNYLNLLKISPVLKTNNFPLALNLLPATLLQLLLLGPQVLLSF